MAAAMPRPITAQYRHRRILYRGFLATGHYVYAQSLGFMILNEPFAYIVYILFACLTRHCMNAIL